MNPISSPVSWWLQTKRHWFDAFVRREAPSFVFSAAPLAAGEIPVFTFHTADPLRFEAQCAHLARNGYRTLSSAEYVAAMRGEAAAPEKSVLITFDDGLRHVWTVAHPVLRRHGLRATCFLVAAHVPEGDARPTLLDVEAGRATMGEILDLSGDRGLANWTEIRAMRASGVIDFQSHSLHHHLVPTGPRIVDFVGPNYRPYALQNVHVPVYRTAGIDDVGRTPTPGLPVYESAPRFQTLRRFFDAPSVREACVRHAAGRGPAFFQGAWKRELARVAAEARRGAQDERYETREEATAAMRDDLAASKRLIEERLGGTVDQIAFPWYDAVDEAVRAAADVGYRACHFGGLRGRPVNRVGGDPMRTVRIEETFLLRLPGRGRQSVREMILDAAGRLPRVAPAAAEGRS